jgi:dTDP-4-dehydrorhamnose reductase
MLKLAKEKDSIDVVDEEVSCFTYTPDLARATKELIETEKPWGIYHLVNSKSCTWYQAARYLFKIAGIKVKVNPITSDKMPRPARRPKYSVLKNTKFIKLRDWREALNDYLRDL